MDIRVSGKNLAVTEGMREHLQEKLSKFEKYSNRLVESHVILKKEKYFFVAEITLLARHLRAYGEASSKENIFTAIDLAYVRVEKQLKKFREKLKDHHKRGYPEQESPRKTAEVPSRKEAAKESIPPIVKSRLFVAGKPLFPEDASQQLRDSSKPFLVFQNASTQKLNVIYRREDGNHGLIEPGF